MTDCVHPTTRLVSFTRRPHSADAARLNGQRPTHSASTSTSPPPGTGTTHEERILHTWATEIALMRRGCVHTMLVADPLCLCVGGKGRQGDDKYFTEREKSSRAGRGGTKEERRGRGAARGPRAHAQGRLYVQQAMMTSQVGTTD